MSDPVQITSRELHTIDGSITTTPLQELLSMVGKTKATDPTNADADCDRALIFEAMGQVFAARQSIAEALRIDPLHPRALELSNEICALWQHETSSTTQDSNSLLSKARLDSLHDLVQYITANTIKGDVIECGVAGGGSLAVLASSLAQHKDPTRRCIGLDTFSGMPAPDKHDTTNGVHAQQTGWGQGTCSSGGVDRIQSMLSTQGLSDGVELVEGLFEQTLPTLRDRMIREGRKIALLHCDADWYSSTRCIAENLFDLVSPGGVIQIDDYGHWDGCRKAINEVLNHLDPIPTLHRIDYTGRWFTMPAGYELPRTDNEHTEQK